MAAVLSRLTGLPQEDAEALTSCTTTPYAYEALINGVADLLLVYEPAEETKQKIEESGVALEMIPIGRDALVFIVNEQNPISGLTTEELQNIYTGKVSNWSELGGEDAEIVAFQRVSASGSQALFLKLLMAGLTPMEAPTELAPAEMGELIERLAEYNNAGNALGYSVFYYASYMYEKPGLKFLAVDGVTPTDETIADGSYPLFERLLRRHPRPMNRPVPPPGRSPNGCRPMRAKPSFPRPATSLCLKAGKPYNTPNKKRRLLHQLAGVFFVGRRARSSLRGLCRGSKGCFFAALGGSAGAAWRSK